MPGLMIGDLTAGLASVNRASVDGSIEGLESPMGRRWIGCDLVEPLIDLGDNVVEDDGSATIAGPSELVDRQARGLEPAILG